MSQSSNSGREENETTFDWNDLREKFQNVSPDSVVQLSIIGKGSEFQVHFLGANISVCSPLSSLGHFFDRAYGIFRQTQRISLSGLDLSDPRLALRCGLKLLENLQKLTSVEIRGLRADVDSLGYLCVSLKRCISLTELCIQHCDFKGDPTLVASNLLSLIVSLSKLKTLQLVGGPNCFRLQAADWERLLDLKKLKQLQNLDLSENDLFSEKSHASCTFMADLLSGLAPLSSLKLNKVGLPTLAAEILARKLEQGWESLLQLEIQDHQFESHDIASVVSALFASPITRTIDFDSTDLLDLDKKICRRIKEHNDCSTLKAVKAAIKKDSGLFVKSMYSELKRLGKVGEMLFKCFKDTRPNAAQTLLGLGAPLTFSDAAGNSILHVVSDEALFDVALSQCPDVNVRNGNGATPLHAHCNAGNVEIIRKLLSKHAETLVYDSDGRTPLHLAVRNSPDKALPIVQLLSSHPIDLDAVDCDGNSALHCALRMDGETHFRVARELIHAGCYLFHPANDGKTPLDLLETSKSDLKSRLLLFGGRSTKAQSSTQTSDPMVERIQRVRALVFQGGSVKGLAYIGALEHLVNQKKYFELENITTFAGTSAGAITALLLALRFNLHEIKQKLSELSLTQFLDGKEQSFVLDAAKATRIVSALSRAASDPLNAARVFFKLNMDEGVFKGDTFLQWIEKCIAEKLPKRNRSLTFEELHTDCGCNLIVVGSDMETQQEMVFSAQKTPHVFVADAIRISMSIPGLFVPHAYRKKDAQGNITKDGRKFVDGGLLNNYPINLVVTNNDDTSEILGFRLVEKTQKEFFEGKTSPNVQSNQLSQSKSKMNALGFGLWNMFNKVASTLLGKQDSDHAVREIDKSRTVYIDTVGVGMLEFDISEAQKAALIASGEKAASEYMQRTPPPNSTKLIIPQSLLPALLGSGSCTLARQGFGGSFSVSLRCGPTEVEKLAQVIANPQTKLTDVLRFFEASGLTLRSKNKNGDTTLHCLLTMFKDVTTTDAREEIYRKLRKICANYRSNVDLNAVGSNGLAPLDKVAELLPVAGASSYVNSLLEALSDAGATKMTPDSLTSIRKAVANSNLATRFK